MGVFLLCRLLSTLIFNLSLAAIGKQFHIIILASSSGYLKIALHRTVIMCPVSARNCAAYPMRMAGLINAAPEVAQGSAAVSYGQ
jgi:hypothetical protein